MRAWGPCVLLVAAAAGAAAQERRALPLVCGGEPPLAQCPNGTCASVSAVLGALFRGHTPPSDDHAAVCAHPKECVEPLIDTATNNPNISMPSQLVNNTMARFCSPTCPARPPAGDGEPHGTCSSAQIVTGLVCCDDPIGELHALGTSCLEVAEDVTTDCYVPVNSRMSAIGRCPADAAGAKQREVQELCPRRCRNAQHPGCECPKAYDKGCPTLNCLVPDEKLYEWGVECGDCTVSGANLDCTEPFNPVTFGFKVTMFVLIGLVGAGLIIYVVRFATLPPDQLKLKRRQSSIVKRLNSLGGVAGLGGAAAGATYNLFDRYRMLFERTCYRFGWFLATHRTPFYYGTLTIMLCFTVCGLPQAQIDKSPTSTEWAPSGGRLERQLKYYNQWTAKGTRFPNFILMVGPSQPGDTALRRKYLEATHRLMEDISQLEVTAPRSDGNGTMKLRYEDFCYRLAENPVLQNIHPGETPCIHPGPLDCFFEGAWQIENVSTGAWPAEWSKETKTLDRAVVILNSIFGTSSSVMDNYHGRPSYRNLTDAEIRQRLSDYKRTETGGCRHWFIGNMLKRNMAYGGIIDDPPVTCPLTDGDQQVEMVHANFLVTVPLQMSTETAKMARFRLAAVGQNDLTDALEAWQDKVRDFLEEANDDERRYPGTRISVVFSTFYSDVIKELSSAQFSLILGGFLLMSFVIFWEMSCKHPMDNLVPVAATYFVVVVSLSTMAAYGILATSGTKLNHLMLQVLPYLSIGLGVDDMFLLLHYFREVKNKKEKSTEQIVAELMHGAGRSVTLTSLTNVITFFGGTVVTIPALRNYLILGGLIVCCNYVSSMIILPLMLAKWVEKHRHSKPYTDVKPGEEEEDPKGGIQVFVEQRFSPAMQTKPVQLAAVGVWIALMVVVSITLNTVAPITVDFKIIDLAPKGTHLAQSVGDFQDNVYNQLYQHKWLVELGNGEDQRPNVAEPEVQVQLQLTAARLGYSPEAYDPLATHWLRRYFEFAEKYNSSWVHKTDYYTGEPIETGCDSSCMEETGDNFTACSERGKCGKYRLGNAWWIKKEHFWEVFHTWRHPILGGVDAVAAFAQGHFEWGYTKGAETFNPRKGCQQPGCNETNTLTLSQSSFAADTRCVRGPDGWKAHTDKMRGYISEHLGEYAYPRPTDKFFDVELFETTQEFFWNTLAIGVSGVLLAGFVVPVSPRGAVVIALSGLAGVIELTGLLMLMGVDFTTTIAVSLIMSIGLSVDPVVHAVSAYEHCEEPAREQRLHHCVMYSTIPIVKSTFSTMLSFVMMAFSPFPYVFKFSFLPLFTAACISLVHGTVFVPALLGLVGSSGDIVEEDNEQGDPEECEPQPYAPDEQERGDGAEEETQPAVENAMG